MSFGRIQLLSKPLIPHLFYKAVRDKNGMNNFLKPQEQQKSRLTLIEAKSALLVEDNDTNKIIGMSVLKRLGSELIRQWPWGNAQSDGKRIRHHIHGYPHACHGRVWSCKKIRKFDNNIPIIALSASVLERDKQSSQEAGFNHHLGKPMILDELYSVLSNYFELGYEEETEIKDIPNPQRKARF